MARLETALALARDGGDGFVSWAIALKTFFAVLALAGLLALGHAIARWQSGDYAVVTVQLPADSTPEIRVAVLDVMRRTPGVARVAPIPERSVAALLAPWLGDGNLPGDLPLPTLIDVGVEPGWIVDWRTAETRLHEVAPEATLDTGLAWVERLVALARAAQILSIVVLAFVAVVAALTVAFATRAALTAHRHTIELMHWLGARDDDVARAFRRRALWLGLRGGLFGTLAALAAVLALGWYARQLEAPLLLDIAMPPAAWLIFAAVPLASMAVSALAARTTVMRALRRMF